MSPQRAHSFMLALYVVIVTLAIVLVEADEKRK